jgi:type VI secretion system protein VasD
MDMFSFIVFCLANSAIPILFEIYHPSNTIIKHSLYTAKLYLSSWCCGVTLCNRMRLTAFCAGTLIIASCTTPLVIDISAANALNPDAHQHSLPVQVKLFELRDDAAFTSATFHGLWQHEKNVIGPSLLFSKSIMVNPNSQMTFILPNYQTAKYFAVMAIYRRPNGNHWRKLIKIPNNLSSYRHKITINLSHYKVIINK